MIKKITLLLFSLLFSISCTIDYDIKEFSMNEAEQIIVNSYLNPFKPIRIDLYQLQNVNKKYICSGLSGCHIILKEDETILFNDICPDSIFKMDYFPKAGSEYAIEISYKDLHTVKAKTFVPEAIECNAEFILSKRDRGGWESWEQIVKLESFKIPRNEMTCLWITSCQLYENGAESQYNELYTKNVFVDNLNSVSGMDIKNEFVGSVYYSGFLRIKNKNMPNLQELLFTPDDAPYIIEDDEPDSEPIKIRVKLITSSPEYDRYNKSLFEQKNMIIDVDFSAIVYQPLSVYSNIENGLGIFAGYNEANYIFDLPEETNY